MCYRLGVSEVDPSGIAMVFWGFISRAVSVERLAAALARRGPDSGAVERWLRLSRLTQDFPRHLSQPMGGFALTQGRLTCLVSVETV